MHALFVKDSAINRWSISSKTLREFVEHFGPGTEQLDIYSEDGRVSLTSYTEKVMSGNRKKLALAISSAAYLNIRGPQAATPHHSRH